MGEHVSNDRPEQRLPRSPSVSVATYTWLDRACILVPALDAERSLGAVLEALRAAIPELERSIVVIDDGSRDATAGIAREHGVTVITSDGSTSDGSEGLDLKTSPGKRRSGGGGAAWGEAPILGHLGQSRSEPFRSDARTRAPPTPLGDSRNRGKGSALRAGLEYARARGKTVALTVDADGQHPAEEARRVLFATPNERALVLGVRDLVRDGAPRANRFSNGISNVFLSGFAQRRLRDTQCGLRRYPVAETLALRPRGEGYDFEAEVLLRAVWSGLEVVERPVHVHYPADRSTHFRVGRDVRRIIRTVLETVGEHWLRSLRRAGGA